MKATQKELLLYQILERKKVELLEELNSVMIINSTYEIDKMKMELFQKIYTNADASRLRALKETIKRNEEAIKGLAELIGDIENKKYDIWKKIEEK